MNKDIKKLLLIVSSVLILGNIVYFSDSKLAAPPKVDFQNDHILSIQSEIVKLKDQQQKAMDADFFRISDFIEMCLKESYITNNERDELLEQLVDKYTSWFIKDTEEKFKFSKWYRGDHRWMIARIKLLRSLTIQSGTTKLIQGEYEQQFTQILNTIGRYNEAMRLTGVIIFTSCQQSREDIALAADLLQDQKLKYCYSLVTELKNFKSNLNKSHFNSLERNVNLLYSYRQHTIPSLKKLYESVCNDISEYNINAYNIYGYHYSTDNLAQTAEQKFKEGLNFLDMNKERIISYPKYLKKDNNKQCVITEIKLYKEYTKVEISITVHPGNTIQISRSTYLRVGGDTRKFYLTDAFNIPYAPRTKEFNRPYFDYRITLYFNPIPLNAEYVNLIEEDHAGRGWEFRDIRVK